MKGITLTLTLLSLFAPQAAASVPDDLLLNKAETWSYLQWNERGTPVQCADVTFQFYNAEILELGFVRWSDRYNRPWDCVVYLNTWYNWRIYGRNLPTPATEDEVIATLVYHEMGHLAGRKHEHRGIMMPTIERIPREIRRAF